MCLCFLVFIRFFSNYRLIGPTFSTYSIYLPEELLPLAGERKTEFPLAGFVSRDTYMGIFDQLPKCQGLVVLSHPHSRPLEKIPSILAHAHVMGNLE